MKGRKGEAYQNRSSHWKHIMKSDMISLCYEYNVIEGIISGGIIA